METRRWVNPSQPQTMQIGVYLCYVRGVFTLLSGLGVEFLVLPLSDYGRGGVSNPLVLVAVVAGLVAAGWLIANDRKLGWKLGVGLAALPIVCRVLLAFGISFGYDVPNGISPFDYDGFGLIFDIGLFALLMHPQSRDYQRIWFK